MDQTALLRILDANLNRAREALRVVEDHARFVSDDADAARRAKQLRHALRQVRDQLGPDRLLAARDIAGDVGADTKTPSEQTRRDAGDVVAAAFARLAEALRCVGEYAKPLDAAAAALAERQRYDAYALEQRLLARGDRAARLRHVSLYVIVTESICATPWKSAAAAALAGGAGCLQLREKQLGDRELLARARWLRDLTRAHDALLFVNDRPDLARLVDADGVHLGQDDLPPQAARRIVGGDRLIGLSTHTRDQLGAALEGEADAIAVGPIHASATKPQDHIAGIETLAWAAQQTTVPLIAIGGITATTAAAVRAAGASCLCVCSAVLAATDPRLAAEELLAAWRAAASPPRPPGPAGPPRRPGPPSDPARRSRD